MEQHQVAPVPEPLQHTAATGIERLVLAKTAKNVISAPALVVGLLVK